MNTLRDVRKECSAYFVTAGKNWSTTKATSKKNPAIRKNAFENNFVLFSTKMNKRKKCRSSKNRRRFRCRIIRLARKVQKTFHFLEKMTGPIKTLMVFWGDREVGICCLPKRGLKVVSVWTKNLLIIIVFRSAISIISLTPPVRKKWPIRLRKKVSSPSIFPREMT